MPSYLRVILVIVAITIGTFTILRSVPKSAAPPQDDELIGQPAPAFSLPLMTNAPIGSETRSLEDYRGQVVIIDFWATYCGPCLRTIPYMERLMSAYGDRGVSLISLNADYPDDEREGLVRAFASDKGMTGDILFDNGRTAFNYGAFRIPKFVMIDRQGVVRQVFQGYTDYRTLEQGLQRVLSLP